MADFVPLIVAAIALATAIASAAYTRSAQRSLDRESSLRARRLACYEDFLNIFSTGVKHPRDPMPDAYIERYFEMEKNLLLFGSGSTVAAFVRWKHLRKADGASVAFNRAVADIVRSMRSDCGLSNHGLSDRDILGVITMASSQAEGSPDEHP